MQGDSQVLEALNEVLTAELTAINQYFIHAKMCANWGYQRLARKKREESIDEMKDADAVIERILYLDGVPNMQRMNPVRVGEDPIEQHRLDLALEVDAVGPLQPRDRVGAREGRQRHARAPRAHPAERRALGRLAGVAAPRRRPDRQGALPGRAARRRHELTARPLPCAREPHPLRIRPVTLAWIWIAQGIGGATPALTKLALDGLGPFGLVVARQLLGALFLVALAALPRRWRGESTQS